MREAVVLTVFLAAICGGGLWLLRDSPDEAAPRAPGHAITSDYRPGPAWLHRRLGQTVTMAPLRALTRETMTPSLGAWSPPLP